MYIIIERPETTCNQPYFKYYFNEMSLRFCISSSIKNFDLVITNKLVFLCS